MGAEERPVNPAGDDRGAAGREGAARWLCAQPEAVSLRTDRVRREILREAVFR